MSFFSWVIGRKEKDPHAALEHAVRSADAKSVARLLPRSTGRVNRVLPDGKTLLVIACALGREPDVVKLLLDAGADPNLPSANGTTGLLAASWLGHVETVALLVAAGSDVNCSNDEGITALMAASVSGREEVARVLLDAGAEAGARSASGLTARQLASGKGHVGIERMLESAAAERQAVVEQYFEAVEAGEAGQVRRLLETGTSVSTVNARGIDALMMASYFGRLSVVEHLLKCGADVNRRSLDGMTAVGYAAMQGHSDVIERLLREKPDVETVCVDNGTPLIHASSAGHRDVVEMLLAYGANVNRSTNNGPFLRTALGAAQAKGHESVVKVLRDAGALEVKYVIGE